MIDPFRAIRDFGTRLKWLFTGDCGHFCEVAEPYGFVSECGCPIHDVGNIERFQNPPTYPYGPPPPQVRPEGMGVLPMIAYLLAVCAVFFISRTIAMEDGPFGICSAIRGRIDPLQQTWLGRGVNCPLCVGAYVALLIALLLPLTDWQTFLLTWWGLAGASAIVHLWGMR